METRNIDDLVKTAINTQVLRNPEESVILATAKLNHLIKIAEHIDLDLLDPTKSAKLRSKGKEVDPKRASIDKLATYISALRACTDRQPGFEERVDNALMNLQNLFIQDSVREKAREHALKGSQSLSEADLTDAQVKLSRQRGVSFDAVNAEDVRVFAGQQNYNRAFYEYLNTEVLKGKKVQSTFADLVADVIITSVAKHQQDGKKSEVLTELAYNANEVEKALTQTDNPPLLDALNKQGEYFKSNVDRKPALELDDQSAQGPQSDYQQTLVGPLSDLNTLAMVNQLAQLFKDIDVEALTEKKHADKPALEKLTNFLNALNNYANNKSDLQSFCANNATTSPLELYKNALIESSAKQDAQQDKTSRKLVGFFKSVLPGNKGDIATTSSVLTTLLTNDSHLPSVINGALKSHDPANRIVDEAMKYADKSARFELK